MSSQALIKNREREEENFRPLSLRLKVIKRGDMSPRFPWEAFSALKLASILLPISAILSSFQAMTALEYLPIRVIRGKSVCHVSSRLIGYSD
jgi:hypothetical protein